jgi:hypothetical protein
MFQFATDAMANMLKKGCTARFTICATSVQRRIAWACVRAAAILPMCGCSFAALRLETCDTTAHARKGNIAPFPGTQNAGKSRHARAKRA